VQDVCIARGASYGLFEARYVRYAYALFEARREDMLDMTPLFTMPCLCAAFTLRLLLLRLLSWRMRYDAVDDARI